MGFGAVVAVGEDNALLPAEIAECLVEVRVEQSLDEPSRFALRVREDVMGGRLLATAAPELKKETILTIAVETPENLACLIRGPVTELKLRFTLGGPGSFLELKGADRRVELNRECFRHPWSGRGSDIAATILSSAGFEAKVQATERRYGPETETLNQSGTDLDLLRRIARENGLHFWLAATAALDPLDPTRRRLRVTETAHIETSPFRAVGAAPLSLPIALAPTSTLKLRPGATPEGCHNLTNFEVNADAERPSGFEGSGLDARAVRQEGTSAADPATPLAADGQPLTEVGLRRRTLCAPGAGDAGDARRRAEAELSREAFFVTARGSTTLHMLGGVPAPHDVVEVEGAGPRHSGPYRVKSVVHVITAADHFMDLELETNVLGPE